ncbi:MAG: Nucleoside-diphosphate-sugar epimerase [Labilithrix sp.]|nr:Nucleoside-diphosphate-sugar epimerase [Labilithrix sp.]
MPSRAPAASVTDARAGGGADGAHVPRAVAYAARGMNATVEPARVLVLGCGYAGTAIARLARERGLRVVASVRSDARASALRSDGFEVLQRATLDETIAEHVDDRAHVVVAFPPDGLTDARIAPSLARALALTYLSSTGVYGDHRGVVDDTTPVPASSLANERSAKILAAEKVYAACGATIFRCPALYGRDRGLHMRVIRGEHRIPGDGTRCLSRIHVEDLAQLVLAAGSLPRETRIRVAGDREPAPHVEVVRFVSEAYGVPMPPFVPLESVHESLRADRRVDASRVLSELGVTLRYPTYREGMKP